MMEKYIQVSLSKLNIMIGLHG